jgi:hypothetical protein
VKRAVESRHKPGRAAKTLRKATRRSGAEVEEPEHLAGVTVS